MPPSATSKASASTGAIVKRKPKAKAKPKANSYHQHMVRDGLTDDSPMKYVAVDVFVPVQMYLPAEATYYGCTLRGELVADMMFEMPNERRLFRASRRLDMRGQQEVDDTIEGKPPFPTLREVQARPVEDTEGRPEVFPDPIEFVLDKAALRAAFAGAES